jgi:TPR repeat protein
VSKKHKKQNLNAIQPGFQLHWYEIRDILGQGGFGITYLAYDKNLAHEVAIKEYMPIDLATRAVDGSVVPVSQDHVERYEWGLERFIEEARTLGQFKHPNIVRVRNVFKANNTAYMVMDYELGESLQEILSRRKVLEEADIATVIFPIMDGMKQVHAHGFIHRDIKPANIFIRVDGEPVLLDFGSARQAMEQSRVSLTSLFSKGYAPIEQYNSEEGQGPWTDIYALGATMYRAVAGVPPADAVDRSSAISVVGRDTYVPASEIGEGRYSRALLEAIDYAMRFRRPDRPQTITEWQAVLYGHTSAVQQHRETLDAEPPTQEGPVKREAAAEQDPFAAQLAAASFGDPQAQLAVAFHYAKGIGAERNEAEAVKWYTQAAEQGLAAAQFNLGVMYAKGRGVTQNYAEAFKWYRRSAKQGDPTAQATVASMYMKGVGTEKNPKKALEWSLLAAAQGHQNAMFNVGEMYLHGLGTTRDPAEAFRWYRRAAELGHVGAQINLGFMYGKGQGVARDDTEALRWYRRAAEAGNPNAQYNLGVIYAKGRGIAPDVAEARKWYQRAADQGEENALRALARFEAA